MPQSACAVGLASVTRAAPRSRRTAEIGEAGFMEHIDVFRIEQVLDHQFQDHDLVRQAVTHASLVDNRLHSNERLEFLGDAVLGLVVCSYLFGQFPDLLEGEMTKIKSTVVSRK